MSAGKIRTAVAPCGPKRWSIVPAVYEMLLKQPRKDCPISLQNHGDEAWFRDIKIRRITPKR